MSLYMKLGLFPIELVKQNKPMPKCEGGFIPIGPLKSIWSSPNQDSSL